MTQNAKYTLKDSGPFICKHLYFNVLYLIFRLWGSWVIIKPINLMICNPETYETGNQKPWGMCFMNPLSSMRCYTQPDSKQTKRGIKN